MKKFLLIAALLATALAACARVEDNTPTTSTTSPQPSAPSAVPAATAVRVPVYYGSNVEREGGVTRFIDGDAGMLCYRGTYEANVSCVPLSHTLLRPDGTPRSQEPASSKH